MAEDHRIGRWEPASQPLEAPVTPACVVDNREAAAADVELEFGGQGGR